MDSEELQLNNSASGFLRDKKACQEHWAANETVTDGCEAIFDDFICWPPIARGQRIEMPCHVIFENDLWPEDASRTALGFRYCNETGFGEGATNYTFCSDALETWSSSLHYQTTVVEVVTVSLSIASILALSLSVAILSLSALKCDRFRIHKHFCCSLLLHAILMVFLSVMRPLYKDTDWLCKILISLLAYSSLTSIMWMFVEGYFLHSRITTSIFDSAAPIPLYLFIGWGSPILFVTGFVVSTEIHYRIHAVDVAKAFCWKGYSELPYVWILIVPMTTALLVRRYDKKHKKAETQLADSVVA